MGNKMSLARPTVPRLTHPRFVGHVGPAQEEAGDIQSMINMVSSFFLFSTYLDSGSLHLAGPGLNGKAKT